MSRSVVLVSQVMKDLFAVVDRIARTDLSVLITGATGVGKELVARRVHEESARASGPFVPVNCGALAPQLVPGELFGSERGAFNAMVTRVIVLRAALCCFQRVSGRNTFWAAAGGAFGTGAGGGWTSRQVPRGAPANNRKQEDELPGIPRESFERRFRT